MVYSIDPLQDSRWEDLIRNHPQSSVFHCRGWLAALRQTYSYTPVAFTTSSPGHALTNGITFCVVDSWLTGSRLVSLPFTDHCQPLASTVEELQSILKSAASFLPNKTFRYIELRPLPPQRADPDLAEHLLESQSFAHHSLDLRPELHALYARLHKSCIQRKIERAEKEGLQCEEGRSEATLSKFYTLQVLTRRRHGLLPQPLAWFKNLLQSMGNVATISLVSQNDRPIAGLLTLQHRRTLVYKYGCSDEHFHSTGVMPLLFWRTIQRAKRLGMEELDLGRTDLDNPGLLDFKRRLGATSTSLRYYRYTAGGKAAPMERGTVKVLRQLTSALPASLRIAAGSLLYRHMG